MPKTFVKASNAATVQLQPSAEHPILLQLQLALDECVESKGASEQQAKAWGITESGPVFIAKKQAFAMLSLNEAGETVKHYQVGPQEINQVGNLIYKRSQSAREGEITPLDNATLEEAIQALQAFIAPGLSAPSRLLRLQLHDGTVHYVQVRLAVGDLNAADVVRLPDLCAHWQACAGEQAAAWLARWQSCYAELNTALNSKKEFAPFPNQPNAPKIPADLSEQARDLIHQWCKLKKEERPKELQVASDEAIRKLIYEAWMQQCPDLLPGLLLLTSLFPQLLAHQSIEDILHWPRVLNSLPLLFPQHTCSQQLALAPEVLSYFTKTSVTAHGLAMLLTAPIEAKPEHYRVAVTPEAPGKPPTLNLIGIENTKAFINPISQVGQENKAQHSLAMKSFIALLPGMQQPADNTLMNAFTNQTGWLVATQWLLAVQRCNARYERWITDGLISEQEAAQTLKIPLKLAKHSAVQLAERWDRISDIFTDPFHTTSTLTQAWRIEFPIVYRVYQRLASQALHPTQRILHVMRCFYHGKQPSVSIETLLGDKLDERTRLALETSQQANLYGTEANHTESLTQVLYQLWHARSHNNQNALSNTCAERLATCPLNLQQALLLGFVEYFPGFLPGHLHVHPRALANALTQSPIAVRDWILGATTLTLDTHVTLDDTATPPPPEQRPCRIECRTHPTAALNKVLDFQFPALVGLCVDLGADAHALEGNDSALHRIAKQGYTILVEALADKHVFLENLNADSLSPLDTAMERYCSLKTKKNSLEAEETSALARLPECVLALVHHGAGRHLQQIKAAATFFESFQSTTHASAMHDALITLRGRCPALDWHLTCQTLFQTEPPTIESMKKPWWPQGIAPEVYSTATEGTFYLRPAIALQLFDKKGNPRNTMNHGRRPVVPIKDDTGQIIAYAKAYPEAPMIEQAVFQLAQSLFGRGITPSALFRFEQRKKTNESGEAKKEADKIEKTKKEKNYIPILLSSPVPGDELQSILISPTDYLTLKSLDKEALSELILLTLLTAPEDAKPDNYRLRPLPLSQKDGTMSYRIVGIDNDHSFIPAIQYSQDKSHGELNLKSIILCLDAMQNSLELETIQHFLAIKNPAEHLQRWLEQLIPLQNRVNELFDADTRARLFERKSGKMARFFGHDDLSVILQCPFARGQTAALWEHWKALQALLVKEPTTTPLTLLRHLYPAASLSYIAAFNSRNQQPLDRFRHIIGNAYSEKITNHFKTLKTSRALYESMGLRHIKLIHPDDRLGLNAALCEIKGAQFEAEQYQVVRKALLKPLPRLRIAAHRDKTQGAAARQQDQYERLKKFNALYLESSRQAVLKDLNIHKVLTNLYPNENTDEADKERYDQHERIIIEGLKQAANIELTLAHLMTFTDEDLKIIGQNSPGLTRLTLNDCPQITEQGLKNLLEHTQVLHGLILQSLGKFITLDVGKVHIRKGYFSKEKEVSYTPTLTCLTIRDCPNLMKVRWEASTLMQLHILNCPELTEWENHYSKLTKLSLQNLPHLTPESLRRLASYQIHLTHCHLADDTWSLTLKQHCLQPLLERGHLIKAHLRLYLSEGVLTWPPVRWPYPSDSTLRYIRDKVGVKIIDFDGVKGGVNSIEHARLLQFGFKLRWHSYVSPTFTQKHKTVTLKKTNSHVIKALIGLFDGTLVLGLEDGTIECRHPETFVCIYTLKGHPSSVSALAILANGTLVSGGQDKKIKLWHPETYERLHSLSGHSSGVSTLTTLADGTLVSGSEDGTIKLWHPETFECIHTCSAHFDVVKALTILVDGTLVSGSEDGTIRFWHPETFECINVLIRNEDSTAALTTLADGTLVSGSHDGTIKLRHPETFECIHTLRGHKDSIAVLTILSDGTLISGSWDNTIKLWHPTTLVCLYTLRAYLSGINALTTLANGILVSSIWDYAIESWYPNSQVCLEPLAELIDKPAKRKSLLSAESKQEARVTPNHTLKRIQLIQTSTHIILRFPSKPSAAWLDTLRSWLKAWGVHSEAGWSIQTNHDNTDIRITEVSSRNNSTLESDAIFTQFSLIITPPTNLSQTVRTKVINHYTHTLWVGLCPENVELLDTTLILDGSRQQKKGVLLPPSHRTATTLQPGAPWHAIKSLTIQAIISKSIQQALYHQLLQHTRHLKALALKSWENPYTLQGHSDSVLALTTLSDGTLISASRDSTIRLWHPETFKCLHTLTGHSWPICALTTLADGTLVSGSEVGMIKLWHPQTFECLHTLSGHLGAVFALTTLLDGTFVSGGQDTMVKFWHPETFKCLHTLSFVHSGGILALTTLADGTLISGGGGKDGKIKLWHPQTFECLHTLSGHLGAVFALKTLLDGTFVSGGQDTMVKFWHPETFKCLHTLSFVHSGGIRALTTLADGTLISGGGGKDGKVKLWHPQTFECLHTLSGHQGSVIALTTSADETLVSGSFDKMIKVWPFRLKPQPVLPPKTLRQLIINPPNEDHLPKTWRIQYSNYHSSKHQASSNHTLLQAVLEKLGCPAKLSQWKAKTQQLKIKVTPTSAEHLTTVESAMATLEASIQGHRKAWRKRSYLNRCLPTQSKKTQREKIKEECQSASSEVLELGVLEEKKEIRVGSSLSEDRQCTLSKESMPPTPKETASVNTVTSPITQHKYSNLTHIQLQQQIPQHRIQQLEKKVQDLTQGMADLSRRHQHLAERERSQPSTQGQEELAKTSGNLQAYQSDLQQTERSLSIRLKEQATHSTQTVIGPHTKVQGNVDATVIGTVGNQINHNSYHFTLPAADLMSYLSVLGIPPTTSALPPNFHFHIRNVGVIQWGDNNIGIKQGDYSSVFGQTPASNSQLRKSI